MFSKKLSSRTAVLCLWLLVQLFGQTSAFQSPSSDFQQLSGSDAQSQGGQFMDNVRGVVKGVVDTVKGIAKDITYKTEDVFDYDLNNDGQVGEFRSQEDAVDTRQVAGDPNGGKRFQISRPRTGRALSTQSQEEVKAAPALKLRRA